MARAGLAAALAVAGTVTVFEGTGHAAAASYKAVPATGPSANAAYVIQITGTGFTDAVGTSQVHAAGVIFASTCGADNTADGTHLAATAYAVATTAKLVVTTPSLTLTGTSTAFKVCVYDLANALLGSTTYTVYAAPTVTSVGPASGPAFGGNTVTVVGTGFTKKATATIAGVAVTNVKVTGTTSLTGTVPARAASATATDVVITTEGGPSTGGSAAYTYKKAISVSPQYGASGTILDITGVGFAGVTFGTVNGENSAVKTYVYFVPGIYNPTTNAGVKTLGQTGTCSAVQIISDTELTCTAPAITAAAYTITVVTDGSVHAQDLTQQSVVSSKSTFTYATF
ncbi:MAG: IPT/TIG domain-containing protein [Actinobacteria bacterium]|nr:IPT/TIG domain-containing protein [Actinomycetota bacterium]